MQKRIISSILIIFLLLFIYLQIATRIMFSPVDFDEGGNLLVSVSLHSTHFLNYSTFDALFDPQVSTGPTILIPAALLINNNNPLLPRIVMLIYAVIFIFICLKYLFNTKVQQIIFLVLITLTPLFYFFSSHVLGELPGFVFLLLSLLVLKNHKYFLCGLFFALSILTKQIYIFSLIAILFLYFSTQQLYIRLIIFRTLKISSGTLSILGFWFFYIYAASGFSLMRYFEILNKNSEFVRMLAQPSLKLIDQRLAMIEYVFTVNGLILLLIVIIVCVYIINKSRKGNQIAAALASYCLFYSIYYIFQGSTFWYRHFFPAVLAFITIFPFFIDNVYRKNNVKQILLTTCIILLILLNALNYLYTKAPLVADQKLIEQNLIFYNERIFPPLTFDQLLKSQIQTAEFIKKNIPNNNNFSGISWWNALEIQYLAKRRITRDPFLKNIKYIITDYYGQLLKPEDYEYLSLIKNKKKIFSVEGFSIYKKY
jgi:hypothetical protein